MTLDTSKRFRFIEIRQSMCRGQSVRRKPVRFHDSSLNDFIEDWKPEKKDESSKTGNVHWNHIFRKFKFLKSEAEMNGHGHDFGHESVSEADSDTDTRFFGTSNTDSDTDMGRVMTSDTDTTSDTRVRSSLVLPRRVSLSSLLKWQNISNTWIKTIFSIHFVTVIKQYLNFKRENYSFAIQYIYNN